MQQTLDISSLSALDDAVRVIRDHAPSGSVIYLHGDLGVGKTTFAQHWLRQLGVTSAITSPTYTIANEYDTDNGLAIHADLYRIHDPEELLYLDVREWTERADIVLIEWPEKGEGYAPPANITCTFNLTGDMRRLLWQTNGNA